MFLPIKVNVIDFLLFLIEYLIIIFKFYYIF